MNFRDFVCGLVVGSRHTNGRDEAEVVIEQHAELQRRLRQIAAAPDPLQELIKSMREARHSRRRSENES